MIFEKIIKLISSKITALDWVEVYGGTARMHREKVSSGDFGDIYKKYPISCEISGDVPTGCVVGKFRSLVPNSRYKSLLYWELISSLSDSGAFKGTESTRVLKGTARLIGFINQSKFGSTDCNVVADAQLALWKVLNDILKYPDFPIENGQLCIRVKGEVPREELFSKYDYQPIEHTFFYPFDVFGLDVNFELILPLGCIPEFTFEPEICVDFNTVS